jgi:hypothetical protein
MEFFDRPERESALIDLTSKWFCRRCNSGWMNELDDRARPFLTDLMFNRQPARHIHEEESLHLARWSFKTALTLLTTTDREYWPPLSRFRSFYETRTPPHLIAVGYLNRSDVTSRFLIRHFANGLGLHSRQVLFAFGALFIGVFYEIRAETPIELQDQGAAFLPIFPYRRPISWPPAEAVNVELTFRKS